MDLISILLPTRNRPLLARLAVEAALQAADADCELIVADNGDSPLALPQDERLRHLQPASVWSMPDNWERALDAARGEWLMLLSDKFMLVPGALAYLRRRARAPQVAVTYGHAVLRQGLPRDREDDQAALRNAGGRLQAPRPAAPVARDSRASLVALYRDGARYPRTEPMLYTALVHRSLIERARAHGGSFFFGPCPDVASALQVLAASEAFLATQAPVVMVQYPSASSEWSTGASTFAGGARARGFFAELGEARQQAGRLVSTLIFDTLREFARRRPDLASLTAPGWSGFAWAASREIEDAPLASRPALHWSLLRLTQAGRLRPRAAWVQARAALVYHAPAGLVSPLLRLRRRLGGGSTVPEPEASAVEVSDVATRAAAFARLSRELAEAP